MIERIGKIQAGWPNEVKENCIRLYAENDYPVLELYGLQNKQGNLLMTEEELIELGKELTKMWNKKIEELKNEI